MRKPKKFHYIYKITRNDGKYYIGMHSTDNLDDGYFGSGKRLWHSIRKYGKEVHIKEIIEFLSSREELKKREAELVNEECIADPLCMNIDLGGNGGGNFNAAREKLKKLWELPAERERIILAIKIGASKGGKKSQTLITYEERIRRQEKAKYKKSYKATGKKHSDISKNKISNASKGKVWLSKDNTSIKVFPYEMTKYIAEGWERKKKQIKNQRIWMYNDELMQSLKILIVEQEHFQQQGWKLGRKIYRGVAHG